MTRFYETKTVANACAARWRRLLNRPVTVKAEVVGMVVLGYWVTA